MDKLSTEATKALLGFRDRSGPLYYLSKNKFEIIFRPLTLKEYKTFMLLADFIPPYEVNNLIAKTSIIFITAGIDRLLTTAPAGLVDSISDVVLSYSGFDENVDSLYKTLYSSREHVLTPEGQIELFICSAFPGTKPNEVQNMDYKTQMKMVAMAEIMLGRPFIEEKKEKRSGRNRLDPEAQAILSPQNADKPDFRSDNANLNSFQTGRDRMGL